MWGYKSKSKVHIKLTVSLLVLGLSFLALSTSGVERSNFLPLDQIKPGMEGIGKTVVKGSTIESFDVKVVDVIDNPGELFDFILVRVSGGAIVKSGGISGGMSGSPIYIDGKLVGALSRSVYWQESAEPLAWVTPIETMFELVDAVERGLGEGAAQADPGVSVASALGYASSPSGAYLPMTSVISGPAGAETGLWKALKEGRALPIASRTGRAREVKFVPRPPSPEELRSNPQILYAVDLPLAPIVGGLSRRAFNWLKEGIDQALLEENRRNLLPGVGREELLEGFLQAAGRGLGDYGRDLLYSPGTGVARGTDTDTEALDFVPGAPLGALLMSGDDYFGWFGTVTYKEEIPVGDRTKSVIVGFGHPMLEEGESYYFLNPVAVLDTVDTLKSPFKLGVPVGIPGAPVLSGVILEDRYQGIAGIIGEQPQSIKFNLRVRDEDRGLEDEYHIDLVPMRDFYPVMALIAGYDGVYSTINRVGAGTMKIHYTIRGQGMPKVLERDDIFVDSWDIALTGPLQIGRVAYLLAWNEFQDPQLTEIDAEISVTKELKTVIIENIQTDKSIYQPGDKVHYEVVLQSYRGEQQTVEGTLKIPEKFQGGEVRVWAVPASEAEAVGAYSQGWTRPMPSAKGLKDLIEDAESLAKGDTLYVFLSGIPSAIWSDYFSSNPVCQIVSCLGDYLDAINVTDLGLEGAVTGYDYWPILVQVQEGG